MTRDPQQGLSADSMAAIRRVFFEECEEHLTELEEGLAALQRGEADSQTLDTVFRAAHSIKGGAGIFDLQPVIRLAHLFESVLDLGRTDASSLTAPRIKALLKATDGLADLIRAARDGREIDETGTVAVEAQVAALISPTDSDPGDAFEFEALPMDFSALGLDEAQGATLHIEFRPTDRLYATANEPLVLLRELALLGALDCVLDDSRLPTLDKLEPEESYLSWSIVLTTDAGEGAVREVFDFVEDECDLSITTDGAAAGARDAEHPREAAEIAEAVVSGPAKAAPVAAPAAPTIRVDLDRVDRLVDLVSELVINQAMLVQQISAEALSRRSGVPQVLDDLAQLTRQIQDSVMAIRAQPVRSVFQRMGRLVREAEAATGKPVRLVTEGDDTEVDRTVIERLTDPLTHMIRNAIDHGL